jgi:phosphoglycolate phosphatase-like HAD superfamily hydrolase
MVGPKRHIVWDWNGTLLDDLELTVASVNEVLGHFGAARIDVGGYQRAYTRPLPEFYARLLPAEVVRDDWPTIERIYHTHYLSGLERCELTSGAANVVGRLTQAGFTHSLLSMWWHGPLVVELSRRGIEAWFERVDGNRLDAFGVKAEHLVQHLSTLPVAPEAVLIVGDALDDLAAACAAGVDAVFLASGTHPRDELVRCGVPVLDHLAELAELLVSSAERSRGERLAVVG